MRTIVVLMVLITLGGIAGSSLADWINGGRNTWYGEILFEDENEYLEFKRLLATDEVKVKELEVLSSPNNFVKYKVTAPNNYVFGYNGTSSTDMPKVVGICLGIGIAVCIVIGLVIRGLIGGSRPSIGIVDES